MTAAVPAELAAACGQVRPADKADAVGGVVPRYVAAPTSTQEASAVLRAAAGLGLAVVPRGAGTRLDWGAAPTRCDLIVDTTAMDTVLEHAAGDLVVRVQAGVRLDRLAEVLAKAGQRLALDPPAGSGTAGSGTAGSGTAGSGTAGSGTADGGTGSGGAADGGMTGSGTVGGLIATGVAGPLRLRFGAPRDLLIGITIVRADGAVARAGGKVVKNVAGYDIGKLLAGSYGTLGLITEATFRLHPSPPAVAYVSMDCPDAGTAAAALLAAAGSALAPAAAELDWPRADAPVSAAILLEGDPGGVAERAERMCALLADQAVSQPGAALRAGTTPEGGSTPEASTTPEASSAAPEASSAAPEASSAAPEASSAAPAWWGRGAAAGDGTVLRIAFWAGQLAAILGAVREIAAAAGVDPVVSGSGAAGVLHAALPSDAPVVAVAQFVAGLRATLPGGSVSAAGSAAGRASAVVLHAPPNVRKAVDMWGPVPSAALMRSVKDQFDPEHRMAPGRFAGGI